MQYSTVLITGVAGFIASNLAVYLVKKYPDTQFVGIDKLSYCSSLKNLDDIATATNWKFIQADFTQFEKMDEIFNQFKPDAILHLGAETHVDLSFDNSIEFTYNNVIGTHVLLELSKKYKVSKFVHTSTDEVYGSQDQQSTENSLLDPSNPYSASKAGAENLCRAYWISFKLPVVIVRGNNVYGPRQFPEKVVGKFILRLEKGMTLQIQGSGAQRRSFLYVEDMCRAFEILLQKGISGEIYNIGSNDEISIQELAKILSDKYQRPLSLQFAADRPFNDMRYFISSDKIAKLGWKQEISLDIGLTKTIKWYQDHPEHWEITRLQQAKVYDN